MNKSCEAAVHAVGGAAVIELAGEVDGGAAGVLNAAYEQAVGGGEPGTVVLDFARVGYINSTGIALIVSVLARARAERRKVVASGLSEHYREIFDITRLSDFIEVFGDLDAAVSQLAGRPPDGTGGAGSAARAQHDPHSTTRSRASGLRPRGGEPGMDGPRVTMDVRHIGGEVAVVDIKGEVTAACEPVLMSAYEEAGGLRRHRLRAQLRRPGVHEQRGHRDARDPAGPGQPPAAAAGRVRAYRALPRDLRAHPPR